MGDAVASGKAGQKTPNGFYNIERMLKGVVNKKGSPTESVGDWGSM